MDDAILSSHNIKVSELVSYTESGYSIPALLLFWIKWSAYCSDVGSSPSDSSFIFSVRKAKGGWLLSLASSSWAIVQTKDKVLLDIVLHYRSLYAYVSMRLFPMKRGTLLEWILLLGPDINYSWTLLFICLFLNVMLLFSPFFFSNYNFSLTKANYFLEQHDCSFYYV